MNKIRTQGGDGGMEENVYDRIPMGESRGYISAAFYMQ